MPGPRQTPASNPYRFAVSPSLRYAGVDQGIDFTGAGDVFALGDAIVTRVERAGSGWPGEGAVINYRLLSGSGAGRYVYVAEDLVPTVQVGQHVRGGQTIAKATGSGKAPGIEMGWAQASGVPLAPRPPARPAPQYTSQGADFLRFVHSGGSIKPLTPGLVAGNVAAGANAAARHVPGVAQVEDVGSFLGKISDPSYILRGLQIVAGAVLVLVGTYLLARQVGLAVSEQTPQPVKDLAARAPVVASVREARAQSRSYSQGRTQGRRSGARREGAKQGRAEVASREPIETGVTPVYEGRAKPRPQSDDIPF